MGLFSRLVKLQIGFLFGFIVFFIECHKFFVFPC